MFNSPTLVNACFPLCSLCYKIVINYGICNFRFPGKVTLGSLPRTVKPLGKTTDYFTFIAQLNRFTLDFAKVA